MRSLNDATLKNPGAAQVASEYQELTRNTTLLLAYLLQDIRRNLPPDVEAKLGKDPDISVKVGDQQVFKGTKEKPVVNSIDKSDIEYIQSAIRLPQGVKHSGFERDVEIKIKGQPVFEMKGGEVVLNQITATQNRAIHLDIGESAPVHPTIHDPQATIIQPPSTVDYGVETIEHSPPMPVHSVPNLHDFPTAVEVPLSAVEQPRSDALGQHEEQIVEPQPNAIAEGRPQAIAQPEQRAEILQETSEKDAQLLNERVYRDARSIVDMKGKHDPTWTEKSFIGAHFSVTRFVDQVTVEAPKQGSNDREVVLQGNGKDFSVSKVTPELAEKIQGAAEIVRARENEPEQDPEPELSR